MLIDTHAHISDPAFDADRDATLARAGEAGVRIIIDVGTDIETSRRAIGCAAAHDGVFAAIGVHPYDGDRVTDGTIAELGALARSSPKVVAIGETGLDFFRERSSREGQARALRAHLGLARELGLPVILHLRSSPTAGEGATGAYEAAIAILRESGGGVTGVSHCFSGTPALARALAGIGFYVSFAGNATYPKAEVLREAARETPLDRILVETDCPYLAPQARRGARCEPAFVRLTAEALAAARGMPAADLFAAATDNARRLFRIDF